MSPVEWMLFSALVFWMAGRFIEQSQKKKVAYTVHIQGRTEQDEHMDFAVVLFEDDKANWARKLQGAFELREERLKFQNERVLKIVQEAEQQKKEA